MASTSQLGATAARNPFTFVCLLAGLYVLVVAGV